MSFLLELSLSHKAAQPYRHPVVPRHLVGPHRQKILITLCGASEKENLQEDLTVPKTVIAVAPEAPTIGIRINMAADLKARVIDIGDALEVLKIAGALAVLTIGTEEGNLRARTVVGMSPVVMRTTLTKGEKLNLMRGEEASLMNGERATVKANGSERKEMRRERSWKCFDLWWEKMAALPEMEYLWCPMWKRRYTPRPISRPSLKERSWNTVPCQSVWLRALLCRICPNRRLPFFHPPDRLPRLCRLVGPHLYLMAECKVDCRLL